MSSLLESICHGVVELDVSGDNLMLSAESSEILTLKEIAPQKDGPTSKRSPRAAGAAGGAGGGESVSKSSRGKGKNASTSNSSSSSAGDAPTRSSPRSNNQTYLHLAL